MLRLKNLARAFVLGIRDGWTQPYELSTSANVDHLDDGYGVADLWLDRGINVGQLAHAGLKSQAWSEGYWPVAWNGNAERSEA